MRSPRGKASLVIAGAIAVVVGACAATGGATAPATDAPIELMVFAAASLKGALEVAGPAFAAANPGVRVVLSTDSSAALRAQIEQGAPADLFLSADTANPSSLVEAGLADGQAVEFASNVLTVIVPPDNPGRVATPADLARAGLKIVAAGDKVPITIYANQVVEKLAGLEGYPTDFAARYAASIVSREDNVKAVVAKIELGEGDAAIVYATDARASTGVVTVEIPDAANVLTTYTGVVVAASPHRLQARSFFDWLTGVDGRAILVAEGFLPPP